MHLFISVPYFYRHISLSDLFPNFYILHYFLNLRVKVIGLPITVAELSEERNVFARSNTGIVSSKRTRRMDVCLYSAFVLSCRVVAL
jgi:hypothetical protein